MYSLRYKDFRFGGRCFGFATYGNICDNFHHHNAGAKNNYGGQLLEFCSWVEE
jgi:hypothetical protein